MHYVEIAETRVPALGTGTWQLRGDTCRRAVTSALEIGYRSLDTAQAYENEQEVGAAVERSGLKRRDLFVTTKVWADELAQDASLVQASLDRLRMDFVDLLLVHWPSQTLPLRDYLDPLVAQQQQGRARKVGVSNFPPLMLSQALEQAPVFCNQVEYHPYLNQQALLEQASNRELMLTAYCPLAQGRVLDDEILDAIGRKHSKNPAQVTLRWLIQQHRVAAIPRSADPRHLQSNFDIFDFELSAAEMTQVLKLQRGLRLIDPDWAPDWEERSAAKG